MRRLAAFIGLWLASITLVLATSEWVQIGDPLIDSICRAASLARDFWYVPAAISAVLLLVAGLGERRGVAGGETPLDVLADRNAVMETLFRLSSGAAEGSQHGGGGGFFLPNVQAPVPVAERPEVEEGIELMELPEVRPVEEKLDFPAQRGLASAVEEEGEPSGVEGSAAAEREAEATAEVEAEGTVDGETEEVTREAIEAELRKIAEKMRLAKALYDAGQITEERYVEFLEELARRKAEIERLGKRA